VDPIDQSPRSISAPSLHHTSPFPMSNFLELLLNSHLQWDCSMLYLRVSVRDSCPSRLVTQRAVTVSFWESTAASCHDHETSNLTIRTCQY
jgi:hypothetical protein